MCFGCVLAVFGCVWLIFSTQERTTWRSIAALMEYAVFVAFIGMNIYGVSIMTNICKHFRVDGGTGTWVKIQPGDFVEDGAGGGDEERQALIEIPPDGSGPGELPPFHPPPRQPPRHPNIPPDTPIPPPPPEWIARNTPPPRSPRSHGRSHNNRPHVIPNDGEPKVWRSSHPTMMQDLVIPF